MFPRTPAAHQLLLEALGTAAGPQRQMVAPRPRDQDGRGRGPREAPDPAQALEDWAERGWPSTAWGLAGWEAPLTEDEHAAPVDHGRVVVAGGRGGPGGEGPGGEGQQVSAAGSPITPKLPSTFSL